MSNWTLANENLSTESPSTSASVPPNRITPAQSLWNGVPEMRGFDIVLAQPPKKDVGNFPLEFVVLVLTIVEPYLDLKEYFQAPCTGTLISPIMVFTTASCLIAERHLIPDPSFTTVHERSGNSLKSLRIYIHPKYIHNYIFNFAVIIVEKSKQKVFPKLPVEHADFHQIRNKCVMGGYGNQLRPTFSNFQITHLNDTEIKTLNCRQTSKALYTLCLNFNYLCSNTGDIGSPILCGDQLYALFTPWVKAHYKDTRCMDLFAALFTTVYPVTSWVERVSAVAAVNLEWMNNPWYIMLLCASALAIIGGIYYCLVEVVVRRLFPHEFDDVSIRSSVTNIPELVDKLDSKRN